MHSFLNNIVEAYAGDPDLGSYTFVFPNARSRRYFAQRLSRVLAAQGKGGYHIDDMCMTLSRLIESGSGMKRASSERLLFLLYKAYRDVCARAGSRAPKVHDFDRFRFWGQRILNDFNDVDHYMASADEVFRNAADYKEIQALYLNDAQKRIIEAYWDDDPYWSGVPAGNDGKETPLWSHVNADRKTEKKFIQLWALLADIYHRFHELLQGECYPGMAAKAVAEALMRGESIRPFNPRLYVFIGFNRLTTAEHIIFEQLDERRMAHFYWDYDPALMAHTGGNPANRFIGRYVRRFTACKEGVKSPERPAMHRVDVIGVPSSVGQAKVMAQILQDEESAVILPEEDMLLPVVASIPEKFKAINVTMGYPMRYSALSQLFARLVSLQLRAMKDGAGGALFFRDDVRAIITSPMVQAAFGDECRWLDACMRRENLYNLPAGRLATPELKHLSVLMRPLGEKPSPDEMTAYVADVLKMAADTGLIGGIDAKCAEVIAEKTDHIVALAKECGVELHKQAFFNLIEQTLFRRTLPLEGESFEAMQVMGVLETRAMGFSNVVMLSMTDSIFPGSDNAPSFIPEILRHAYGLPTRDHEEVDSAYHFYHILSAARHLTLIYDARVGGLTSGEMSRYIHQLLRLGFPGVDVRLHLASFTTDYSKSHATLIPSGSTLAKSPRVMDKLNRFRNPAELHKFSLSATALKDYLHCPMHFYLKRIEGINPPDPETEGMSAADYGNVIHEAADRIYKHLASINRGTITDAMLADVLDNGNLITRELTRAVNLKLNKFPEETDGEENSALYTTPVEGEAALIWSSFEMTMRRIFSIDRQYTPFDIIATELSDTFSWHIAPGIDVNFTMKIDRLDRVTDPDGTKVIRVIDYKTGDEKVTVKDLSQFFDSESATFREGIFQLLVYCAAYSARTATPAASLRPHIFTLRAAGCTSLPFISCDKKDVTSYAMLESEFMDGLRQMFADIFDASKPIKRSDDDNACTFCKFYHFCHKDSSPAKNSF